MKEESGEYLKNLCAAAGHALAGASFTDSGHRDCLPAGSVSVPVAFYKIGEAFMKKIVCAVAVIVLAAGTAVAQTSGLKAGLWEIKTTRQVMDGRDMTAQMNAVMDKMTQAMANMSPDQRKKVEAMTGGGSQGTIQVCVSRAMAEKNQPMVDRDGQCAAAKVTRNGNQSRFEFDCTRNGSKSAGTGTSTVHGDTIVTAVDMTMTDSRGQHSMQNVSVMHFLGADCQGVVPVDQMAKKNDR